MLKQILPASIRIKIRLFLRRWQDWRSGQSRYFARSISAFLESPHQLSLKLALKPNPAKLNNLKIASQEIAKVYIAPGEIFSFWEAVPAPYLKNGYQASRSIVGKDLQASIGGGLCQLSGMIYYLSLMAGLEVIERYPHSRDIYTDETRFTPLGSDATVVYAYKDLRIRNNLQQAIQFSFDIAEDDLSLNLISENPIHPRRVSFEIQESDLDHKIVHTLVDGHLEVISHYAKMESA